MLAEVTYRRSLRTLALTIGLPLLPLTYGAWASIQDGGVESIFGWLLASAVLVGAVFVAVSVLVPESLTLTSDGLLWRTHFGRHHVRWCEIASVGLHTRQRLSLKGGVPASIEGVGYTLKTAVLEGKRGREAISSLGITGWHGVLPDIWTIPPQDLQRELRRYMEAAAETQAEVR